VFLFHEQIPTNVEVMVCFVNVTAKIPFNSELFGDFTHSASGDKRRCHIVELAGINSYISEEAEGTT
jgi:hypothetical protein